MKIFIITSLFLLIGLPAFAQQCEEGDVRLLRGDNTVYLKECRFGTLSDPLVGNIESFFEANQNDSIFTSVLAVLNIYTCRVGICLSDTQSHHTVSVFINYRSIRDLSEIMCLEFIADKYRQWLAENK